MTEKCFDIGTIQAFLDGELASDRLEAVSRHISFCDECAILLHEAEEETAFAFSALEKEFNDFVPTNRLWTKINDSIEQQKKSFWQTVRGYFSIPTVAAFAGLVIVVGLFAALFSLKTGGDKNFAAAKNSTEKAATSPIIEKDAPQIAAVEPEVNSADGATIAAANDDKNKFKAARTAFSPKEIKRQPSKIQKANAVILTNPPPSADVESNPASAAVLGEESYLKTIATLEKTVDSRKDEVLKPSARFAFERDLAVTNDAITKMKAEVAKNPQNEAAKDVLRASYRNKIDLLNSVAEKSELMASLK